MLSWTLFDKFTTYCTYCASVTGGFQDARGATSGAEFYIENVFEELDNPFEWFFNSSSKTLYYFNNDSDSNNSNINNNIFEATNLKVLFNMSGDSMENPIKNIEITGMEFVDTQVTYLDGHGMPSGGDWGLQRTGAVYVNNAQNVSINNNLFSRLDGNAISINRFGRNISIFRNEFRWQGDSVVTQWGDTSNITVTSDVNGEITEMGYDGSKGNQPRGTNFSYNLVHEIGLWEKQSSMWFQSKSCQNIIENNIFFNGPRAAININDGFGGGNIIRNNLLFNSVSSSVCQCLYVSGKCFCFCFSCRCFAIGWCFLGT